MTVDSAQKFLERALGAAAAQRDRLVADQKAMVARMPLDPQGRPVDLPKARRLHPRKHIAIMPGLLSREACAFLIELAQPLFEPAMIFNAALGRMGPDPYRTNEAAHLFALLDWPFVTAINHRIAAATDTDIRRGEYLQVLRYSPGQEYKIHVDSSAGRENQRTMTALIYLNDDYSGGETAFPDLDLTIRGQTGDMLVFSNTLDGERSDREMRHAGLPVTSGVKYLASRWIRQRPLEPTGIN